MRKLWIVPALGLALLLVLLLLLRGHAFFRGGGGGSRGEEGDEAARRRALVAAAPGGTADTETSADPLAAGNATGPPLVTMDGRLVYGDGTPAVGVLVHLAVGRPVEVRVFRNGEYTDKTVYLVTKHDFTGTDADGRFRFAARRGARWRSFVYTVRDPQAFVVEEFFGGEVRARRRVKVAGRLVGTDGKPLDDYWFEGRLGKPEDWHTRVLHEEDSFVAATGDLKVDPLAIDDTRTRADGSFSLLLAEGKNSLVFGEIRAEGSTAIDVVAPATDLGEVRVPGVVLSDSEQSLSGQVLTLAGAPHADCDVLAWDGSVGLHTHAETTDEKGMFTITGLRSSNVILWAVPTGRRHIDLPVQTSGTIRMPCGAPIVLHAPAETEYAWADIEVPGFYLFVRKGVFAAGESLDGNDVVGLPPGPLDIHLVTGDRILEASLDVREAGDLLLASAKFRDTTWD